MAWEFLHIVRREFQGSNNWGEMHIRKVAGGWEWLCYTYELPWKVDSVGKTLNKHSRIQMGIYELTVRTDGDKGWRLQLQKTGHRSAIQIHRAHSSLFIEGCILPVHFNTLLGSDIQKGDEIIQTKSVELMTTIQSRWSTLLNGGTLTGAATLSIAEVLPTELVTNRSRAHA